MGFPKADTIRSQPPSEFVSTEMLMLTLTCTESLAWFRCSSNSLILWAMFVVVSCSFCSGRSRRDLGGGTYCLGGSTAASPVPFCAGALIVPRFGPASDAVKASYASPSLEEPRWASLRET